MAQGISPGLRLLVGRTLCALNRQLRGPWLPPATVISRQASSGNSPLRSSMVRRCPPTSLGLRGRPIPGCSGLVQAGSSGQTVAPPGTSST